MRNWKRFLPVAALCGSLFAVGLLLGQSPQKKPFATKDTPKSYMKVVEEDFATNFKKDSRDLPRFQARQKSLLEERCDLSNNPSNVKMSGGRKAVQQGIRVKLPRGTTWEKLAKMTPEELKRRTAVTSRRGAPTAVRRVSREYRFRR